MTIISSLLEYFHAPSYFALTIVLLILLLIGCLMLFGCKSNKYIKEDKEISDTNNEMNKDNYEMLDGEVAEILTYNYKDKSMYIAGLKIFEEFGTKNEGSVSKITNENILAFYMTKATGTLTGAIDGPKVSFKINLTSNEILDKSFIPAPNYIALGKLEFAEHSEEVIKLSDERLAEIGIFFNELIENIEKNNE